MAPRCPGFAGICLASTRSACVRRNAVATRQARGRQGGRATGERMYPVRLWASYQRPCSKRPDTLREGTRRNGRRRMISIAAIAYGPFSATSTPAGGGGKNRLCCPRSCLPRAILTQKIFRNFGCVGRSLRNSSPGPTRRFCRGAVQIDLGRRAKSVALFQYGEILCCWRPRWIEGSEGSPMHAYTWYVWRKTPRNGASLKVRIGKDV